MTYMTSDNHLPLPLGCFDARRAGESKKSRDLSRAISFVQGHGPAHVMQLVNRLLFNIYHEKQDQSRPVVLNPREPKRKIEWVLRSCTKSKCSSTFYRPAARAASLRIRLASLLRSASDCCIASAVRGSKTGPNSSRSE